MKKKFGIVTRRSEVIIDATLTLTDNLFTGR